MCKRACIQQDCVWQSGIWKRFLSLSAGCSASALVPVHSSSCSSHWRYTTNPQFFVLRWDSESICCRLPSFTFLVVPSLPLPDSSFHSSFRSCRLLYCRAICCAAVITQTWRQFIFQRSLILWYLFIYILPDILQYYLRCSSGQVNPFQQVFMSFRIVYFLLNHTNSVVSLWTASF